MHRPSRPGAYGAEAGVASCARSVSSPARRCGGPSTYALPHVLVGSLAPAAEAAPCRAYPRSEHYRVGLP